MLTADRTSIRRRLAVRRRANGPPWGGVKRGHDAILAPLAASIAITLTAALLVGLGVALVRDERDRRAQGARRSRARQFGLLPGERPAQGLRRMALGQLDLAIELLDADGGRPPSAAAVHDTRKALKRLRALVRTLRPELGEQAYARENAVLRRSARRLSSVRDAEVMVGTLDQLLVRNRSQLAHLGAVRRLRAQFAAERDRAQRNALADSATLRETASELRAVRERVAAWELRGRGMRVCEPGLRRLYGQGRRRLARARRRPDDGRAFHLWRKRVKDLRYAVEMLDRRPPRAENRSAANAAGGARHGKRSKQARWLRRVARRADGLGELLGEEHDLAMLAERVRAADEPFAHAAGARKTLLKVIARRRRRLRKRALRTGGRLYARRPRKFVRRARRAYAAQK